MILVIGGHSKIGSALIDALVARGADVRALARGQESASAWPSQVSTVTGDLADPASLAAAMSGVDRVFLLSSPHQDAVRWHHNAIDAAAAAGVELLVRSSILGADGDSPAEFVASHADTDRYLVASGLPHVILRPNSFLQNIPEQIIPAIDEGGHFYANAGDSRVSMVDTRDVAEVAATVLTEPGHAGNAYDLTGPAALSYVDVAERLTAVLGREIGYLDVPDDAVRAALVNAGLNQWFADALVGLFQDYRRSGTDGYAARVTDTVERLTGRPARSLDDLLAESRGLVQEPKG